MTAAVVRVVFRRPGATLVLLGSHFEGKGTELFLDGKRVARWRHPEQGWTDEAGAHWTGFDVEPVVAIPSATPEPLSQRCTCGGMGLCALCRGYETESEKLARRADR